MTQQPSTVALLDGVTLLERAVGYALGCLHLVTRDALSNSTPCRSWDLRALLRHMECSLTALYEAAETGRVNLEQSDHEGGPSLDSVIADPTHTVRDHACRLLGAWINAYGDDVVPVGGCPLTAGIVTSAGALELAVHGWDVARSCGSHRRIPSSLAQEMLQLVPLLVTQADRPARFAEPVEVSRLTDPSDQLIAFLGRRPS